MDAIVERTRQTVIGAILDFLAGQDLLTLNDIRIALERELFLQCIHRAGLVCSDKSNSVKIKLTSKWRFWISSHSNYRGSCKSGKPNFSRGFKSWTIKSSINPASSKRNPKFSSAFGEGISNCFGINISHINMFNTVFTIKESIDTA